jgi:tripartite-type tricarboxylate transporter receptor subunit TctC
MTSLPTLGPFLPGGKVNLLAVTSKKRIPNASETPTVAEAYKGFDYAAELGILAPAGVPPEVVSKLANAVKMALASPEVQTRLNGQGAIPDYLAPEDYAENLRQNLKKYKKAVEVSKLTPN